LSHTGFKMETLRTFSSKREREFLKKVREHVRERRKQEKQFGYKLEVPGLDPDNPATWITPREMIAIVERLVGEGWVPEVAIIYSIYGRGKAEAIMPTPGIPPNMRFDWFKPKLELVQTEYEIAGRDRTILTLFLKHYGKNVGVTIYRTGFVVVEKPLQEVTELDKKEAYHVATVAEEVLKKMRGL